MSVFGRMLRRRQPDPANRRWLYVPYDQLSADIGPLAAEPADELGIVLVESPWKAARRPYHRQKLALVLANQRQFALEQAARGVAVRYVVHDGPYREALEPVMAELGPLRVMRPAERELRRDLQPLAERGALDVLPHEGWLTTREQFRDAAGDAPPWRMDAFYRAVRRHTGHLMKDGKPAGGKYSLDAENRKPWSGEPPAPSPPVFEPDEVTEEVGGLVTDGFAGHPGRLDLSRLPATAADAERLWAWATAECLEFFGPYEDAMSVASTGIFHTRIAPLLNLHRLLPARVTAEVLALDIPLNSKEGFLRQVLGWREFVRHVHEATDGFRDLPDGAAPDADGPAAPSHLGAAEPLPPAYWDGAPSGLACLDRVVEDVWTEAYSHHITRLMVLANLATLLDVSPRAVTDWFWVAYADAYDWVVEPNVLGMGTYAAGDLMTTKPYVSGAAYINRMSDYCGACAFDPKKTCPITSLYWAFLARHREALEENPRMNLVMGSLRRRRAGDRRDDARVFDAVRSALAAGERLTPDGLADA